MAGNLIFLRRRIRSVRNTQKLTKAMKTVAAAKLRRANGELKRSRAYREKVEEMLRASAARAAAGHPLLRAGAGAALLVVVAGERGLCGAFNSHVLRQAEARYRELAAGPGGAHIVTVGAKAERHFGRRGLAPLRAYSGLLGRLQFADAARLAADLQERFVADGLRLVEFAFSRFVSASKQEFALRGLFPVEVEAPPAAAGGAEGEEYIYEPDADVLFRELLPRHVQAVVHQVLLQSVAAEQVARMVAMDLATRNASDMIRRLTLQLNKMRQAAITKELLEIITATEALSQ
ncbi:MAG TPA: ATP synthase F1 subunit gamma [Candidatus Aminicenantes bacterium]|nr:ATP synthase F1 subunit gamma [Candidatus Aminicenantes bacterium]